MSIPAEYPTSPFVERRLRERRRVTRRSHDRERINERGPMAIVMYLAIAVIAGGAFAAGLWIGWLTWGGS